MHEINVLPIELSWLINYIKLYITYNFILHKTIQGGYPELNRELTVPHTVVLPIELYPPLLIQIYVGVNRTPMVNTKNL